MRVYSHSKPYILLPRWLVVTYVCLGWLMKKRTSLYNFPGGECDLPTESLRCAVLNGRQGRTLNGIATVSRTGLTNGSSSVYSLIRRVQEVCLVFTFATSVHGLDGYQVSYPWSPPQSEPFTHLPALLPYHLAGVLTHPARPCRVLVSATTPPRTPADDRNTALFTPRPRLKKNSLPRNSFGIPSKPVCVRENIVHFKK